RAALVSGSGCCGDMLAELGLIGTIGEDDEVPVEPETDSEDQEEEGPIVLGRKQKALQKNRSADFNPDFIFTEKEGMYDGSWAMADVMSQLKKKRAATTLDEKIEKVRKKRKTEDKEAKSGKSEKEKEAKEGSEPEEQKDFEGKDEEATEDEESETDYSSADENVLTKADTLKIKEQKKKKKGQDAGGFFEDASQYDENLSFQDMNLSRPLLKAITAMGFKEPTPIQKACIPVGLLGKDICACAATGTGKTAAFALPVLERLIYKPRQAPVTRVLVLVPTRELGIQVHSVTRQLAQFCSITTCLAVGGLDVKSQEAALRAAPDILIATPGRLIDHLHNCPSFHLSSIEVLILDEADRMLDEYFEEQMKEIIRMCSHHRQTMLFSATMTDEVKDLASVSLKNPVRIFVNSNTDVAPFLRQEFIRIRPNREGDREAIVAALLMRTFTDHVMLFTQTKKQAHRMHILLGLMGLQVGELHGNLSQTQRLEALRRFKDEQIDILVATDVAARGLDIEGVKTVINFTMPNTIKHYVHRVGRTARAGRAGRSVSLPLNVSRLNMYTSYFAKALQEFDLAIRGKKKRKKFMKDVKKKGEMTADERSQFEILKAQMFAERLAKRNRRAKRARAMPEEEPARGPAKKQKQVKKSVFDEELTNTSKKALKQYRAGPSFEERKQLGLPHQRRGGNFKSKSRYKRRK
ncbi:hypothetical protein E2I00_008938, partial [Balaenoptera physalus]